MSLVNPESARGLPDSPPTALRVTRRARVHQATKAELIDACRDVLLEEGLPAVTVRAVAARLGMTAPALYRYYESREALLEDVIDQLYDELAEVLEAACAGAATGTVTDRFLAAARRFRGWAMEHRTEFGLMFGAPIPGVAAVDHDVTDAGLTGRGVRFMMVWLRLFLEVVDSGIELPRWPRPVPPDLARQLDAYLDRLERAGVPLPPRSEAGVELAMLFLTSWQELYGFICTEVFGHLSFAIEDGTDMFEDRLVEFQQRLNLP